MEIASVAKIAVSELKHQRKTCRCYSKDTCQTYDYGSSESSKVGLCGQLFTVLRFSSTPAQSVRTGLQLYALKVLARRYALYIVDLTDAHKVKKLEN